MWGREKSFLKSDNIMKYAEFFAGIGGFRYGLEMCNKKLSSNEKGIFRHGDKSDITSKGEREYRNKHTLDNKKCSIEDTKEEKERIRDKEGQISEQPHRSSDGFTCVYANEWDKYVCQIYRKNYGEGELYEGDITKVSAKSIPDFDMLVAGFPCPSYSIAGKRKGFADSRGALYFEIPRIAKVKRPRLLLLENVKGLLNHEGGQTFRTILNSLSELGYDCEWEVLNSKNFGVPQNRERVFIIGHLRGTRGGKVFPIGEDGKGINKTPKKTSRKGTRIWNDFASVDTRTGSTARGQHLITSALSARDGKDGARNLLQTDRIRRLTPTECERLQGFPDGWTEGISDTQRYKSLGNAVTTNVITEIGRRIKAIPELLF